MVINRTPPLDERVTAMLAEINQFIDDRAKTVKANTPGVPELVIRGLIVKGLCPCAAYRAISAEVDAEAALAKAG